MKKYLLIVFAAMLGLLTSCYDYSEYDMGIMVGSLKTLPVTTEEDDQYIVLNGDNDGMNSKLLRFQISKTVDFSGESVYVNCNGDYSSLLNRNELSGQYYYRLCAVYMNDTVFAPNVESFVVDEIAKMNDAENVDALSAKISFLSSIKSKNNKILVSSNKDFTDYESFNTIIKDTEEGPYEYSVELMGLDPETTYYVKASLDVLLGSVESNTVSFITEKLPLEVDLGLSVKWASCDVGSVSPYEVGLFFYWGDTRGYKMTETYLGQSVTFYVNSDSKLLEENIIEPIPGKYHEYQLTSEYDAATKNMGAPWRMPTKEEIEELRNNTGTPKLLQIKGQRIYKISSKKNGYENKYILLPCSGYFGPQLYWNDENYFHPSLYPFRWSSKASDTSLEAVAMYIHETEWQSYYITISISDRRRGYNVRGVRPND